MVTLAGLHVVSPDFSDELPSSCICVIHRISVWTELFLDSDFRKEKKYGHVYSRVKQVVMQHQDIWDFQGSLILNNEKII